MIPTAAGGIGRARAAAPRPRPLVRSIGVGAVSLRGRVRP